MGFRHYLGYIPKRRFRKVTEADYIPEKEDDYIGVYTFIKNLGGKDDIMELGKYSDEGYAMSSKTTKLKGKENKILKQVKKHFNDMEHDFNILTRDDLVAIIESYRARVKTYLERTLQDGIDEDGDSREKRLERDTRSRLNWIKYMVDTDENRPWEVSTAWLYEWEIFNLVHILKTFDWKRNFLVICGW